MTLWEQQQSEIATIQGRDFTLNLSDADVLKLCKKAGTVGMTAQDLLQSFVGDLVDGTYSNGSDERMYADEWFARCGFANEAEKTFLAYLIETEEMKNYVCCKMCLDENKLNLARFEVVPQKEDYDLETIDELKESVEEYQETIDALFSDFEAWCEGEAHGTFEEEAAKISAWESVYEQLMHPEHASQAQHRDEIEPDFER